jgi:hypothetical protein
LNVGAGGSTSPGALAQLTLRAVNASPPGARHKPYMAQLPPSTPPARAGAPAASASSAASACTHGSNGTERDGAACQRTLLRL